MIAATTQRWQGMARGSDDFARLEEGGRSSSCPPSGRVSLRIFSDVPRSNSSSSEKAGKRKERDAQLDHLARADRARRTAAVGAYREPTRLVSSILSFEEQPSPPWEPKLAATQRLSCITPRALLQAPQVLGRNTSRTCSACLNVSTPTCSTRRSRRCSAGFCGHAALLAAQEESQAEAHQDG